MPAICDVCGEEISYSEPVFKLIPLEAVVQICRKCIKKELKKNGN